MFYMKHNGEKLEIECDNVYNLCPKCGKECVVDLADVVTDGGLDLYGTASYCPECSAVVAEYLRQMETAADEMVRIAARYKVDRSLVEQIVRSGLERGLNIRACLVGARLGLSSQSDGEELFTLEDAAAAIGGTVEDVRRMMDEDYHEAEDVAKKISQIAARHKVPFADVQQMVARGTEHGEDIHTSIASARLALSMITGGYEYFSEEEMASISGMNTKEFRQMMKERGVEPDKLTTLPGFEWLLQQ